MNNKNNQKHMLKTTPFTDIHIALGAKMAEFAGFNMPIQYPTGINAEHMIVREGVGVFDVSHMGEFWVKGEKALDFLQYITTNDLSVIPAGKCQYTCMPNGKGGIVDDLIIYKYSTTKYLMVVNAGNIDKDWAWVNEQLDNGQWTMIVAPLFLLRTRVSGTDSWRCRDRKRPNCCNC